MSSERQTNLTSLSGGCWSLLTTLSATVSTADWYIACGASNQVSMRKVGLKTIVLLMPSRLLVQGTRNYILP